MDEAREDHDPSVRCADTSPRMTRGGKTGAAVFLPSEAGEVARRAGGVMSDTR
jgi:hypothetical protein